MKDVRVGNSTAGSLTFAMFVVRASVAYGLLTIVVPATSTVGVSPWIVLEPGDQLRIAPSAAPTAGAQIWISGAQLTGVA